MVREALFSILGDAVPGRPFFDLFAGTGAVGLEALSRGATMVTMVERDFRVAREIDEHVRLFQVDGEAAVIRADVYRWAERWPGSSEPVNVFLGPPYPDFERRPETLLALIADLQRKIGVGSVLVVQAEKTTVLDQLRTDSAWDVRGYGRNHLCIWVKVENDHGAAADIEQP
jgi:16S rRNA (guanine(966)-N(2))-methyltransferase RsmD